jgi:hypothetical protein
MAITYLFPSAAGHSAACADFLLPDASGKRHGRRSEFAITFGMTVLAITLPAAISGSGVEALNRIASGVAADARPTESTQRAQVFVTKANS